MKDRIVNVYLDMAKKSCKHCYGTGLCGTMVKMDAQSAGAKIVCLCVLREAMLVDEGDPAALKREAKRKALRK